MTWARLVDPPGRRGQLQRFLLVVAGGVFVGIRPVAAQRVTFAPSLFVEEARTANVGYLGEDRDAFEPDWMTRLGVSLGLRREGRAGQASLRYGGYLERYDENSEFNHTEHSLGADVASASGRRSSVGFSMAYSYGQTQGNPTSLEAADRFLSERTSRRLLRGTVRYDWRGSGRWTFGTTGYGSRYWFSEIPGVSEVPEEPIAATVEDRTEYGATVGLRRAMSARTSLGWEYEFTRYDLEVSGSEAVQNLAMFFNLGVGKHATLSFQVGYFERRVTSPQGGAEPVERGLGLQGQGGVAITRMGRRASVTFAADRSSSSGGSLMGTSTDTTMTVTATNVRPVRWFWTVAARYALRQPTRSDMSDLSTVTGTCSVERWIGATLAVRFSVGYFRQFSEDSAFVGSAPQGAVGLVWSPRGREREGQGGEPPGNTSHGA